ncbi:MAG: hypothetical protein ABR591_02490 [Candidatus Velthaea sp.]
MTVFRTNPPDENAGTAEEAVQPDNTEDGGDRDPLGMPGASEQPG